jgi:hypothetical protein
MPTSDGTGRYLSKLCHGHGVYIVNHGCDENSVSAASIVMITGTCLYCAMVMESILSIMAVMKTVYQLSP